MRDHTPVPVVKLMGTFNRGEDVVVPQEYFKDSLNIIFNNRGVETRWGSKLSLPFASVRRAATYQKTGEAERILVLDNAGNLYDSTNPSIPILSIVGMTDFSLATIFNRAYISPHDGQFGLENERIYVYDGIGGARPAAGLAVASGALNVVDGIAGSIDTGDHAFGVCFITRSGYITPPGGFFLYTAPGGKKADINNLPIGDPSYVVGRILVATKAIVSFDGNFFNQTYYYVPGGEVDNNTETLITVDFFDADLFDDASDLLEQIQEIPAAVGIMLSSAGRMITWGEKSFPNIFRASEIGQPEKHNEVDGFGTVNPGDGNNGVRNGAELRKLLYLSKSRRTYVTQDNGDKASTWSVDPADTGIGTECHGIAKVLDFGENVEDTIFYASRGGLRLFTGVFREDGWLTQNIDDLWGRINQKFFHTVQLVIDPNSRFIAVAVPLDDAETPSHILYADYNEGLKDIKWTTWELPNAASTLIFNVVENTALLKFGSIDGNIYQFDAAFRNDYGNAIDNWVEFALLPQQSDDVIYSFTGCKLRIKGDANVRVTASGLDEDNFIEGESLDLTTKPASLISLFQLNDERCSVKIRVNFFNQYFNLTKYTLYVKPLWDQ
jgi:hypothetical protein